MSHVITPVFVANYPNVFKARLNELSNKEEFSVTALFPPGADLSAMKKAYHEAIVKRFGDNQAKWPKNIRTPFKDQGDRAKDGVLPGGHVAGAVMMNLKSQNRPGIVDQSKQELIDPSKVYSGCKMRASVTAFCYSQAGNTGVSFSLNHLQLVADGEPLSGRPTAESAFTAIEGASTAADIFA